MRGARAVSRLVLVYTTLVVLFHLTLLFLFNFPFKQSSAAVLVMRLNAPC